MEQKENSISGSTISAPVSSSPATNSNVSQKTEAKASVKATFFGKQTSKARYIGIVIVVGLAFWGGTFYGQHLNDAGQINRVTGLTNKNPEMPLSANVDFAPFWKAWNILNERHVASGTSTPPGDQDKVWGAIAGLAASLKDPYTVFFPPEETKNFNAEIRGNFEGVGMEIGIREKALTVVAPLKGSPAEKAGVRTGDKILKIDGKPSIDMTVEAAVSIIRGPKGTTVVLSLGREGVREPIEVKITRAVIDMPTVDASLRKDGIFVIRLYSFNSISNGLFRKALQEFLESGSDKLVLDLRGNPGGYLDVAVDMASMFLPDGAVVVQEDFGEGHEKEMLRSAGYNIFKNKKIKMVVLVDGGSASASEILAGALSEHGVATLVGEKTFGKGSVQELVPVTGTTQLKVTIAHWLTPKGNFISEVGIMPEFVVKRTFEDVEKGRDPQLDKAVDILKK